MIEATQFERFRDIYICPDPQGHRPTWIWFALVDGVMYVEASSRQSSWWQSAMKSGTGQLHVAGKIYQVNLMHVKDAGEIERVSASYLARYHGNSAPSAESEMTCMRVTFLTEIGKSELPKVQV
ncbi:DUF2255 family protein [Lactococcus nasutitermitis]|uniref:DUF2255 family protein n=1 Tax=Lactococcus nasutitermitis TaxID=1652957 RepID=A0ABV9JE83_9LACT|nr:DUF2255 family protein [Lactococcus nasutitermitis]